MHAVASGASEVSRGRARLGVDVTLHYYSVRACLTHHEVARLFGYIHTARRYEKRSENTDNCRRLTTDWLRLTVAWFRAAVEGLCDAADTLVHCTPFYSNARIAKTQSPNHRELPACRNSKDATARSCLTAGTMAKRNI